MRGGRFHAGNTLCIPLILLFLGGINDVVTSSIAQLLLHRLAFGFVVSNLDSPFGFHRSIVFQFGFEVGTIRPPYFGTLREFGTRGNPCSFFPSVTSVYYQLSSLLIC